MSLAQAQSTYFLRVVCAEQEEAHLRALLLHGLSESGLSLQELESSDTTVAGSVEITAHVMANVRNDAAVEKLTGRLSMQPSVSAVKWSASIPSET